MLNSKNEYNRCTIPRLSLEYDDLLEKYEEEKEENEIKSKIEVMRDKLIHEDNSQKDSKRRKKYDIREICDLRSKINDIRDRKENQRRQTERRKDTETKK